MDLKSSLWFTQTSIFRLFKSVLIIQELSCHVNIYNIIKSHYFQIFSLLLYELLATRDMCMSVCPCIGMCEPALVFEYLCECSLAEFECDDGV